MKLMDRIKAITKVLKLDSHHAIERFGVFFGIFSVLGAVVLGGSAVAAYRTDTSAMEAQALYTGTFSTSKTNLEGEVDGVYTNTTGDRALVMMHFDATAAISYDAEDYQAWLMGSTEDLVSEGVSTPGVTGSFHVFGSTGYVGVLLEASQPFDMQVLNLTLRANSELAYNEDPEAALGDVLSDDETFTQYDQWRIFFNPGATGVTHLDALDALSFDPAQAYYDVVLKPQEDEIRTQMDQKLIEMRANLRQIEAYTEDLETTKVDGLFLLAPEVPESVDGDEIVGESAAEAADGVSTLELKTDYVMPGGFDVDWRDRTVYDGYLDELVEPGQSYVDFMSQATDPEVDTTSGSVSQMQWILSDGTDLASDVGSNDTLMAPLVTVMNNLSGAYSDYVSNKTSYQSDLTLGLLNLEMDMRNVQSNSSTRDDGEFLVVFT